MTLASFCPGLGSWIYAIHRIPGAASRKGMQAARLKISSPPLLRNISGTQHSKYPPPRNTPTATQLAIARIEVRHHEENHTPRAPRAKATQPNVASNMGMTS